MRRGWRRWTLTAALMVVAAVAAGTAGTASASHVSCGQTITADTTLDSDLLNCTGDGVIVGASGTASNPITLNLGGHAIDGGASPGADNCGVRVTSRSNVEIIGGTVQQFSGGICIEGGSPGVPGVTVDGVTVQDNIGTTAIDHGDGILLADSSLNKILNSTVRRNGPYGGVTLLGNSDSNTIGTTTAGNTISNNSVESSSSTNQDAGVRLEPTYGAAPVGIPSSNTIENNVINGNGLDGVEIFNSPTDTNTSNTIRSNRIYGNGFHGKTHRPGDGVHVFQRSDSNTIASNVNAPAGSLTAQRNAGSGIVIESTSTLNSITGNTMLGHTSPQWDLWDKNSSTCPTGNTWTSNKATRRNPGCLG